MHLLAPFILKIFQTNFRTHPELGGRAIFGHKMAHLSWTIFFDTNHYYYFHLPIGYFHYAKFLKNSYSRSRVIRMRHSWVQNGPLAVNKNFLEKIINIIFIYILAPFIVQNVKKILTVDPELCRCTIFGPKMKHFPKLAFSQKTCLDALFLLFMPINMPKY